MASQTSKPTTADADLILKLYDLRREAEMRKARSFLAGWMPETADDIVKLISAFGTQENAWLRQVTGYWEMAAALVLNGALNEDLFFASNNELWFFFAKFEPFLKDLRHKMESPDLMGNIEKLATGTREGKERVARMQRNIARIKEMQLARVAKAS